MNPQEYFSSLGVQINGLYKAANEARSKGKDVEMTVECMPAADKNSRCIEILSTIYPEFNQHRREILKRLEELEKEFGIGSDQAALVISKEIAQEKFFRLKDKETAVAAGLRFGCAFNTKGVVGAPLEGITNVKIDPKDNFLYVYYAGPIRTAGGTAQVFTLFIADYIRKALGLSRYVPTKEERERYYTEVNDYLTYVTRKQYKPSEEEFDFLVRNVPICLTGEPTEMREVSRHKDCERAETTRIRGGMCLVYLDGLPLKAEKLNKKLKKYGKEMGLVESWSWLEEFIKIKKAKKEVSSDEGGGKSYKFLQEVPAGRPVFSMPDMKGGFRLRYGRSRNMGSGCFGFHPATQAVLDSFPAVASQMKIEVPGKGCTVGVCDYIEPPIAKLKNGDVVRLNSLEEAKNLYKDIEHILFVGDMLVTYGDFFENGEKLIPTPYVEEVWLYDLEDNREKAEKAVGKETVAKLMKSPKDIDSKTAIKLAEAGIPLHPKYLHFYDGMSGKEIAELIRFLQCGQKTDGRLILKNGEGKHLLEKAIIPHRLSLDKQFIVLEDVEPLLRTFEGADPDKVEKDSATGYELVNKFSKFEIEEKATKYVGARMGRPEKSMLRKMKGSPQILFPVGEKGGRMRNLVEVENLVTDVSEFVCPEHGASVFAYCLRCGRHLKNPGTKKKQIYVRGLLNEAYQKLQEPRLEMIKGVKGVVSKHKIPEPIEKGVLRAKHGLYVFRDGTIRFDMVNAPLTHFKPREVGTSVEKLRSMGYSEDIHGNELISEDQVLELFPQDFLLSVYGEESAAEYFLSISKFVDDLLVKFYGLPAFYNAKTHDDLIGHLFLDIAPHTIAPVVCRLIGFTSNRCHYAHPYLFAATRRDCDGEENGVMLMMDCLLNFSKEYISVRRGSISDAPLTISTILNLGEVDDEVYDMDIPFRYSKEFYQKTREKVFPWEVKIEQVSSRLGKDNSYSGLGYTTENTNINHGVHLTTYKTAEDMVEKITRQLDLAKKLNCVDEKLVAQKILSSHFIKDIKGNFRTFFSQTFRCTGCNYVMRRPPLTGRCTKCNGPLVLTVSEGTIIKYLEASKKIAQDYNMDGYTNNQLNLLQDQINLIFGKKAKQSSLAAF